MEMNIGRKIKMLRKSRGMTQEQLAESLCISTQAVSKWENHISLPDITMAPMIAAYFGITLDELFDFNIRQKQEEIAGICEEAWKYRDKDKAKSRAILESGLEKYPNDDILLNNLLYTLDVKADPNESIRIALKLIDITKQDEIKYDALRILSNAFEAKGDKASALSAIEQIPEIYFTKLTELAYLLEGQPKYEAADKQKWISFEHLLQMMGQLVLYYESEGDRPKAEAEARRALRLMDALADEACIACFAGYRESIQRDLERLKLKND